MGKRAFIFPGQGSQFVGMGRDLYESYPTIKELYLQANEILGFNLSELSFFGPEEELRQTNVTQPALFVHSFAVAQEILNFNIKPDAVAGHSLGEYSALVIAGVIDFEQGLLLVKRRGELMQEAGKDNAGTMAAVIGLSGDEVGELCKRAEKEGPVRAANFNSDEQIVVSGSILGIKKFVSLAQHAGAKRVIELSVSGAFHSPLVEPAQKKFSITLQKSCFEDANIPIYCNVTAEPTKSSEKITRLLSKQLTSPVCWVDTVKNMIADGVTEFYEVGAGKVLTGLLRRIDRSIRCVAVGTVDGLETLRQISQGVALV